MKYSGLECIFFLMDMREPHRAGEWYHYRL